MGGSRYTCDDFETSARRIHGEKYSYEMVEYVNIRTKVKIICPIHGVFEQVPNRHMSGRGCPKCGGSLKSNSFEFIEKAINLHGNTYDYSKVNYIDSTTTIEIICKKHGIFAQTPNAHLLSYGCKKCSPSAKSTTEEFIEKSIKVHSDRYVYNNVNYDGDGVKVGIVCRKHGVFHQTPSSHLLGHGCPKCKSSLGQSKVRIALESLSVKYEEEYSFKDCKHIRKLPFDFGIFVNNMIACIEYQGEQHFMKVNFGGSLSEEKMQKNLVGVQLRDSIKLSYCADNNIPLLLIKYNEVNVIAEKIKDFVDSLAHLTS